MSLTGSARIGAALAELCNAVDALSEPIPVEVLPLEPLATPFGTMTFELGNRPGSLMWTMAPGDRGRSGLGSARIEFYSTRVDVALSSKSPVFKPLDWAAFTAAVHDAVVEAMRTRPGWVSYRRMTITAVTVQQTEALRRDVHSAVVHADWLTTLAVWERIASEPDPVTARMAESLFLSKDFHGSCDELFTVARAAADAG